MTGLPSPLHDTLRSRQRQAGFRLGIAAFNAGCYGSAIGWSAVAVWLGAYACLQLVEHVCFAQPRALFPTLDRIGYPLALAILALNSSVFGSLSILEVEHMGGWGGACAAFLLIGSLISAALNTTGCAAALCASGLPIVLYLGLLPPFAIVLSDHPSLPITIGVSVGGVTTIYSALRLWRDWTSVKQAELAAVNREVAERLANEQRLYRLAHIDPLTEIANRAVLRTRLADIAAVDGPGSLLLIDLDGFKNVNDTLGHSAGDLVLREVADRLVQTARPSDLVARLGGDEFAILLPDIDDPMQVACIADRVIDCLSRPILIDGENVAIGASVGIAINRQHGADADEVFKNADLALYRAKAEGRRRSRIYEPALRLDVANRKHCSPASRGAARREEAWPGPSVLLTAHTFLEHDLQADQFRSA